MPSDSTAIGILRPSDRDGGGDAVDAGGVDEGTADPSPSKGTGEMQQRGCIQAIEKHNRACKETGFFIRQAEQEEPRTSPTPQAVRKFHAMPYDHDLLKKWRNFADKISQKDTEREGNPGVTEKPRDGLQRKH